MKQHPLKSFRAGKSLTQKQLGDMLGVSNKLVGAIERGDRPVTARNARDWSAKTGIPKESLCPEIFAK
jgi:transcriptional regulator with XRE-family HTH domain